MCIYQPCIQSVNFSWSDFHKCTSFIGAHYECECNGFNKMVGLSANEFIKLSKCVMIRIIWTERELISNTQKRTYSCSTLTRPVHDVDESEHINIQQRKPRCGMWTVGIQCLRCWWFSIEWNRTRWKTREYREVRCEPFKYPLSRTVERKYRNYE